MDGDLWDAKVGDAVCVSKGGFGNHTERRFVTRTTETQVVLDDGSRWLRHGRRVAAGGRVRIFAKLWDKDDRATTGNGTK